jgi:hypothetical protein
LSPGSKSYTVDEALRLAALMARQRGMDAQEGRELAAQHRPLSRPRVPRSSAYPGSLGSVRKTGRAVVVDEAPKFAGPGAEIAATVLNMTGALTGGTAIACSSGGALSALDASFTGGQ